MKSILIVVGIIVAILGVAVVIGGDEESASGQESNNYYGLESSTVTVSEYGDFECPACAQFFPIVNQVKEQYKDQIRFEFKHFPLIQIHQNAVAAHRAAEAAAQQGKFWEMHDVLYERQQQWNTQSGTTNPAETFRRYAEELGLNMEQYDADLASAETIGTVNADIAKGRELGVESTPTFFINGQQIEDVSSISTVEGFSEVIDAALAENKGGSIENQEAVETVQPEDSEPEEQ